jgi:DeoR family transcriptional regulator of aga operon
MQTAERRQTIEKLLREQGAVRVADLSARFGVSPSTIRRDLQKLERQEAIERRYGGAARRDQEAEQTPELAGDPLAEEKTRIGQAAANLLSAGETVFLSAGNTALAVACALAGRDDLTVITNGLAIAHCLAGQSDVKLIVVGGLVQRHNSALTGHLVEQALADLHADKVILDVQGISALDGLTCDDLAQLRMAQTLLETVSDLIVVADHTRLGRVCTARIAPVDRADVIVTGRQASNAALWELAELDIKVVLV